MKSISKSMDPDEAAQAFFGQDDKTFSEMLKKLTANDPRLTAIFQQTRERFLNSQNS